MASTDDGIPPASTSPLTQNKVQTPLIDNASSASSSSATIAANDHTATATTSATPALNGNCTPPRSRKRPHDDIKNDETTTAPVMQTSASASFKEHESFEACNSPAAKELRRSTSEKPEGGIFGSKLSHGSPKSSSITLKPALIGSGVGDVIPKVAETKGGFPISQPTLNSINPLTKSIAESKPTGFGALAPKPSALQKAAPIFGSRTFGTFGSSTSSGSTSAFGKLCSGGDAKSKPNPWAAANGGTSGFSWLKSTAEKKAPEEKSKSNGDANNTETTDFASTSAPKEADTKELIESSTTFGQAKDEILGEDQSNKPTLKEIDVVTGEEDEILVLHAPAKLYQYNSESKTYSERGSGTLRLLDPDHRNAANNSSRLTMRGTGTHRLLLNTNVWSSMVFERAAKPNMIQLSARHWETSEIHIYLVRMKAKDTDYMFDAVFYRLNRLRELERSVREQLSIDQGEEGSQEEGEISGVEGSSTAYDGASEQDSQSQSLATSQDTGALNTTGNSVGTYNTYTTTDVDGASTGMGEDERGFDSVSQSSSQASGVTEASSQLSAQQLDGQSQDSVE